MSDRRQRQKEQRAAKREAERKKESRRELGRRLITALVFGLIVVGIFALSGLFEGDSADLPASYEGFRDQPTACDAEAPPPQQPTSYEAPEDLGISTSDTVTATISTSCGDIVLDLNTEGAPATVNSFVFLAEEGFYDGQIFYRITDDFVIEAGDPEANATGGPGYVVPDEYPEEAFVYEEGVVLMANRGARSTGSIFRIVVGDEGRFLTNQFNVLGTITSGQEAIDRMSAIETATAPGTVEQSLPLETVYIESVTIDGAGS